MSPESSTSDGSSSSDVVTQQSLQVRSKMTLKMLLLARSARSTLRGARAEEEA